MQALISEEQLVRHHITYPVIPKIYTVGNCLLDLFKNKAMHISLIAYTANGLTIKTMGTGKKSGAPAGKICTIYGKGL